MIAFNINEIDKKNILNEIIEQLTMYNYGKIPDFSFSGKYSEFQNEVIILYNKYKVSFEDTIEILEELL